MERRGKIGIVAHRIVHGGTAKDPIVIRSSPAPHTLPSPPRTTTTTGRRSSSSNRPIRLSSVPFFQSKLPHLSAGATAQRTSRVRQNIVPHASFSRALAFDLLSVDIKFLPQTACGFRRVQLRASKHHNSLSLSPEMTHTKVWGYQCGSMLLILRTWGAGGTTMLQATTCKWDTRHASRTRVQLQSMGAFAR